ncbi:MAG: PHP domain-containing protein [Deltaproteobacteria bacterium]|nr:PHP domain-containing protein [Deltaproteobacteria bacterium]
MSLIALAAVLSTMHYEGEVSTTGGDFMEVAFVVPAGTQEIEIQHADGSDFVILDWGVWGPSSEFRGWGGGNSEDIVIGVAQSSRSYLPGPIAPGTWTVVIGKALLGTTGNMYTFDVTCRSDATLPVQPRAEYTPVVLAPERRWYAGDFHVHSTESGDARASFAEIHTLARSRGLDFVNLSDHNTTSQHALIAALQPTMPDLLFLRGAEITTYKGHGNSVGMSSYVDHRIGLNNRTIVGVLDDLAAQNALFIVNHAALDLGDVCIGCAWKHPDTPWDKVAAIEIITGNYEISERGFTPRVLELWDAQLALGHRIAAVGGSDDHDAGMSTGPTASPIGSPTTLVLADALSEAAIIAAIAQGRTMVKLHAPDDPDLEVTMRRADGTSAEIGDGVDGVAQVQLAVHITRGATTFVQLWRDGEQLQSVEVTSDEFTTTLTDAPGAMARRYRVEIINNGGNRLVVTSHFYVAGIAGDDGCGCRSSTPTAGFASLLVLGLVLRRRRS